MKDEKRSGLEREGAMKYVLPTTLLLIVLASTAAILCGCGTVPFGPRYWLTYQVESGDWPMVSRISYMVNGAVRETTAVLPWGYTYSYDPGDSLLLSAQNMVGQSWLVVRVRFGSSVFRADSCFNLGESAMVTCRM